LQRLGGALGAATGYLAKSCPQAVPAQPVARLQFMESQVEKLAMALNIMRQPLLDFEESLNADQQSRLAAASSQGAPDRQVKSGNIAGGCGSPNAIEWSINEINQSVQSTTTQRDALKRSFDAAAKETHCPTTTPPTALNRLDTIQARLDSTWRATLSIQVALANFEAELNDAQKVRFDTMNFAAR
jgi:outer membrane murein-binding lipoprotein Lpp